MESKQTIGPVHLMLHQQPAGTIADQRVSADGFELTALALLPSQQAEPFAISFETAIGRLEALPRLFIEPDGSFVWVGDTGTDRAWQLDGVVNDRADRVVTVELKGSLGRPQFDQLVDVFSGPTTPLLVQLVQHSIFLEVSEFYRWARWL